MCYIQGRLSNWLGMQWARRETSSRARAPQHLRHGVDAVGDAVGLGGHHREPVAARTRGVSSVFGISGILSAVALWLLPMAPSVVAALVISPVTGGALSGPDAVSTLVDERV